MIPPLAVADKSIVPTSQRLALTKPAISGVGLTVAVTVERVVFVQEAVATSA
jgi:hypothetical protein